jgi:hypothetical protein
VRIKQKQLRNLQQPQHGESAVSGGSSNARK